MLVRVVSIYASLRYSGLCFSSSNTGMESSSRTHQLMWRSCFSSSIFTIAVAQLPRRRLHLLPRGRAGAAPGHHPGYRGDGYLGQPGDVDDRCALWFHGTTPLSVDFLHVQYSTYPRNSQHRFHSIFTDLHYFLKEINRISEKPLTNRHICLYNEPRK